MALVKDDLKDEMVALIVNADPTLTPVQIAQMGVSLNNIATAVHNHILRATVLVGNTTYNVQ
jgi:hypothetical protein